MAFAETLNKYLFEKKIKLFILPYFDIFLSFFSKILWNIFLKSQIQKSLK